MARSNASASAQILLFPHGELAEEQLEAAPNPKAVPARGTSVVLCGTYRKDPDLLRRTFEHLKDSGFSILSPSNPFIETEDHGFVYMRHESTRTPNQIENKHLDAIQHADFVWFFAPDGSEDQLGRSKWDLRALAVYPFTRTRFSKTRRSRTLLKWLSPRSTVYEAFSTIEFSLRRQGSKVFSIIIDELLCNGDFPMKMPRIA